MVNAERGSGSSSAVILREDIVSDQFNFTSKGYDEICEALSKALKKIRREADQPLPEDTPFHGQS